jgi:hypothetical protein
LGASGSDEREAGMLLMWFGALLVLGGVLFTAAQAIWRGRLSGRRSHSRWKSDTLEPQERGSGFGLTANWPGLALIALGAILLIAGAAV